MLTFERHGPGVARELDDGEFRALRRGHGWPGGSAAEREAARSVVLKMHPFGGMLVCDCRGGGAAKPALVLVSDGGIRRHVTDAYPEHAVECPFSRPPSEARATVRSYSRPTGNLFRLLSNFRADAGHVPPRVVGPASAVSRRSRCSRLASLLKELVVRAELHRLNLGEARPSLGLQYGRLRDASVGMFVAEQVRLREVLATNLDADGSLAARLEAMPAARWNGGREVGVIVCQVTGVTAPMLQSGKVSLEVFGRIAVFGEDADAPLRISATAPGLVAVLLARPGPREPFRPLQAYVHPCLSPVGLMPVDSDRERQTLAQIEDVAAWLFRKHQVAMRAEKPLFDMGDPMPEGDDVETRETCVPDFLVTASLPGGASTLLVVETMGYGDDFYRDRKLRTHAVMRRVFGREPIEHDFLRPDNEAQPARDKRFRKRLIRETLTGLGVPWRRPGAG